MLSDNVSFFYKNECPLWRVVFFIVYFIYKANNMCPNFAFSESLTNQTANI